MGAMPFTEQEFFGVFAAYNQAVWPAPLILAVVAVGVAAAALRAGPRAARWVAAFLALLWAWTGAAYHLLHFTAVNPAAWAFGALFLLQAVLFAWWGVARGGLDFRTDSGFRQALAGAVLLYALILYPLAGAAAGQAFMASPTFGAPCPAVIYTFGLLLLARRVPLWLVVIPIAWAVLGLSAVSAFGVIQDLGLVVSGAVYLAVRAFRPAALPAGA